MDGQRRTHKKGRQTPEDSEMDGQRDGHTRRGGQTPADRETETDGQRETDTHKREKRLQQTDRWADRQRWTHKKGRTDTNRQWTEGGRYDAPFKSFGQQGQLCQLCPFLAHDSLVQVVQQRVQLTDTDVTARAHAEGQVGEAENNGDVLLTFPLYR